ncbi:MAG: SufE family protein [Alphaproteobacteria bacterium]|nr:SufE family protein [Alphaproteobacteria bacterium]
MTFAEIKNILSQIPDPAEKLEFVMELGKDLPPIPVGVRAFEVRGCASRVDIYRDSDNNYFGSADSALVRGIVAVILSMVRGKPVDEIRKMNLAGQFADLKLVLGTGRMNGVSGIISFLESL